MRKILLATALLSLPIGAADASAATRWVVKGGGWGHGLGLSQYGSYGQARAGRNYRQIVKHYFRNTEFGQAGGRVRVLLLASVGGSNFSGATRVGGKKVSPGAAYHVARRGGRVVVTSRKGKVVARSTGALRVSSSRGYVYVAEKDNAYNDGTYRDEIVYRPGASGGVTAVNHIELEKYLRGVVPNESPASWPIEALKAQAVAARSYALGTGARSPVYDHLDTAASQVYFGRGSENPNTDRAVASTRGQVLRHDGRIITAFFHSTSGGHTEDNENIWGGTPLPYIRGVKDPWDKYSPYHRWRLTYTSSRLGNALGVGRLRSVTVTKRGASSRIVLARVRGSGHAECPAPCIARLHGYGQMKPRLGLRDAPSTIKKVSSRSAAAGAAAAGLGSRGIARDFVGQIAPAAKGARITLQRKTKRGWRRAGRGRLGKRGRYRLAISKPGTYRVVSDGDAGPAVRVR